MQRAALIALSLSLPLAATAQTAPNQQAAVEAAAPGPVRQMLLAQQLYDQGLALDDGLLILSAIRLAHNADLRPATGWTHSGDGIPETAEPLPAPGLPQDPLSPAAMALAQMMVEGDSALADLAADIEADLNRPSANRGQLSTAKMALPLGKTDGWTMAFNGLLPAEIALISDTALGLSVQDETGQSLCADAPSARAYCAFTPARNGFFTVTVTAPQEAAKEPAVTEARYRLITN